MKKVIAAMLTIALLLSLSACGTPEKELIWDKTVGAIFVNDTEVLTVTPADHKAAICYASGGKFLSSKLLRFIWE